MNQQKKAENQATPPIDVLGKSAETRRFLLTLLLTTSFHLSSRPISFANDSFLEGLAAYMDDILSVLRLDGWAALDPTIEEGISCLEPVTEWLRKSATQKQMAQHFEQNFRKYFRELNLPWSTLPPVDRYTIDNWGKPQYILLAVGPNIGIGDEMIFLRAVDRLSRCYPAAHMEVSTFHPSLWELCKNVDTISADSDILTPFARAKLRLATDPRALVIFVEFAATPIYRQLERVPEFSRFIYMDTGAQLVRLVDQLAPSVFEYKSRASHSIYGVLDDLLAHIGLEPIHNAQVERDAKMKTTSRHSVFLNAFTSKDTSEVTPDWWAQILNVAGRVIPLHIEIFSGINENTRAYAQAIQRSLDGGICTANQFGNDHIPSIGETLRAAMACDAVLGIDTFTGHLANLKSVPSITVFLSSLWDAWRVPDPAVLNVSVHASPTQIGNLLTRLLVLPTNDCYLKLASDLNREVERIRCMLPLSDIARLLEALQHCMTLARQLSKMDPELEQTFGDPPPYFLSLLSQILSLTTSPTRALRQLVAEAWQMWENSNFSRYLRFLSLKEHA